MRFVTFYFSGTGNTHWAVLELNKLLKAHGHSVDSVSVENVIDKNQLRELILNADYIGFACPIYGANLPRIMRSFIQDFNVSIKDLAISPNLYFVNTFGYVNGFGIFATANLFPKHLHNKMIGYVNIKLYNNIPMKTPHELNISKTTLNRRKDRGVQSLVKFVDHIEKNRKYIKGVGPHLLIGFVIRNILKSKIEKCNQRFKVDYELCNKCMVCLEHCPTKSIIVDNNNFLFTETCTACMRCYNNCPNLAITIGKAYDIS